MRTVTAPLHPEVLQELRALDGRRAQIARRYVRRLVLEPYLGARVERGQPADHGCRRIRFNRDDRPDDLFGARRPSRRRGDEDLGQGPGWRIVYGLPEASHAEIRLVVVLAVASGHAKPPESNGYELAGRRLDVLIGGWRKEDRGERISQQGGGVPSGHVR